MGKLAEQMTHEETSAVYEAMDRVGITREMTTWFRLRQDHDESALLIRYILQYGMDAVTRGIHSINPHQIDCSKQPRNPKQWQDWHVSTHRKTGNIVLQRQTVVTAPYHNQTQMNASTIAYSMEQIHALNSKMDTLNATMLWYYLAHPWLISHTWRDMRVFFPGTTFLAPDNELSLKKGSECVFGLEWTNKTPNSTYDWAICVRAAEHPKPGDVIAVFK